MAGWQMTTIRQIQIAVANRYDMSVAEMIGPCRDRRHFIPRAIAIRLARELTDASLPQLGTAFGGRDHTTIMWSIRRELPETDWEILISVYNQFSELPQFKSCRV
jgi:chromosomal replication initiation ATPase DnaA